METKPVSKFILTVLVGTEQAADVDGTLREVAEATNARLTRSDFVPAKGGKYHHRESYRKLRNQGFLA